VIDLSPVIYHLYFYLIFITKQASRSDR